MGSTDSLGNRMVPLSEEGFFLLVGRLHFVLIALARLMWYHSDSFFVR